MPSSNNFFTRVRKTPLQTKLGRFHRQNQATSRRSRTLSTSDPQATCPNPGLEKPLHITQRAVSLPVDLRPVEKSSRRLFWFIPKRFCRPTESAPAQLKDDKYPDMSDLQWISSSGSDGCDDDASGNTLEDFNDQDLVGLDLLCHDWEENEDSRE